MVLPDISWGNTISNFQGLLAAVVDGSDAVKCYHTDFSDPNNRWNTANCNRTTIMSGLPSLLGVISDSTDSKNPSESCYTLFGFGAIGMYIGQYCVILLDE